MTYSPPHRAVDERTRDASRLVGATIRDKYRVADVLGIGGNGIVYEADDLELRRKVAVKIPTGRGSPAFTAMRFRREARAGSAIAHPNVCGIFDFGLLEDGTPFIVMERLVGEPLAARLLRKGTIPVALAARLMQQVLAGLGAAHVQGIVHRDMKPANIMLTHPTAHVPTVKVLDFGSSTLISTEADDDMTQLQTVYGTAVGTPHYMSPEQVGGERNFEPIVDVFACGVILYEMVTGQRPFEGATTKELFALIANGTPVPATKIVPELPRALDKILAVALASNRRYRYPTTEAFSTALAGLAPATSTQAATAGAAEPGPSDERLAYLQARYRELPTPSPVGAVEFISASGGPETVTSSVEIPVAFDDGDSSGAEDDSLRHSGRRPKQSASPVDAYVSILEDVWSTVYPIVGGIVLSGLMHSTFRRAAKEYPFFENVVVTMEGFQRDSVVSALSSVHVKASSAGMAELMKQLISLFEAIAGPIIVKQVVPIAMRLEKLVSSGTSR